MIEHNIPPEDYFGMNDGREKGDPDWVMSRSDLLPFLTDTPRHWVEQAPFPQGRPTRIGNLVDSMVLTPESTDASYVKQPASYVDAKNGEEKKWNGNSKVCKDWLAEAKAGG